MSSITTRTIVASAIRQGDMKRATALAIQALDQGQRDALFLNLRAQAFEDQGRLHEALADLDEASTLAPTDVGVLEAQGLLLLRLLQNVAARQTFERMVALAPSYAHAHFCLGLACEALGELDRAVDSFKRADAMEPGRSETLARIAAVETSRGELGEARRYAGLALARNPGETYAKVLLATIDIQEGKNAAAAATLRAIAADVTLPPADRALAASNLGDALDADGDTDAAFEAYERAGALFVEAFGPQFAGRQTAQEQVAALRAEFEAAPPKPIAFPPAKAKSAAGGHAFLLGFPRSGTTLLEAILTSHPNIVSTEERDHVGAAASLLAGPDVIAKINRLAEIEVDRLRRAYWESVASCGVAVQDKVFLDKLPLNTIKLPLIRRLFPDAKIIFALRDPRDVVFSSFRRRFGMNPSMFELVTLPGAARFYDAVMALYETYADKLPLEASVVRYEDVVKNLEAEARRLCAVLGVEWRDEMRNFAETARRSATPSGQQVKKGLYESGAGQWKRYERHLAPVMPAIAPWVKRWAYE